MLKTKTDIITLSALLALGAYSAPVLAAEPLANYSDAIPLQVDGCNSASRAPIPGAPNLFIARHVLDNNGSLLSAACSPEVRKHQSGLVLEELDWNKRQFTVIKILLPVPLIVSGGPMRGLGISAAFDPDVVVYRGQYWVSFECGLSNAQQFGIRGQASCIAPFDSARQEIMRDKIYVIVSGQHDENNQYSASVPTFLAAKDRLYLYWSVVKGSRGNFLEQSARGAELVSDSNGYLWVKNAGGMAYSVDDRTTVEVWGPDKNNPMSDSSVDIKSLWAHGNDIIAIASLGGSGCTKPGVNAPGCYRMAMVKASQPLGYHIFNNAPLMDEAVLPTNPTDYIQPIKRPSGQYMILGHFYYPYHNGYSDLRIVPPQSEWPKGVKPLTYQDVALPLADSSLWPEN